MPNLQQVTNKNRIISPFWTLWRLLTDYGSKDSKSKTQVMTGCSQIRVMKWFKTCWVHSQFQKLPRVFHLTFQSLLALVCMEVSDFCLEISFCQSTLNSSNTLLKIIRAPCFCVKYRLRAVRTCLDSKSLMLGPTY
jgi:hypothetical protein